jgi:hypothetical protein
LKVAISSTQCLGPLLQSQHLPTKGLDQEGDTLNLPETSRKPQFFLVFPAGSRQLPELATGYFPAEGHAKADK